MPRRVCCLMRRVEESIHNSAGFLVNVVRCLCLRGLSSRGSSLPLLTHLTVRPQSNGHVDEEKDPGDLANVADETTSHVHRLSINSLYLETHDLFAQSPPIESFSEEEVEEDH